MGPVAVVLALLVAQAHDANDLARKFFEAGEQNYAAGRYPDAINNYRRAHELSGKPELLFNLANAHERNGTYAEAARALSEYVVHAPSWDRVALEQRIASLKARAEAQEGQRTELEELRAYRARTSTRLRLIDQEEGTSSWPAYAVAGVGAGLLIASLVTGLLAQRSGRQAEDGCREGASGTLCISSAAPALDEERRFSLASDVLLGLGLAAGATAGVLFWTYARSPEGEHVAMVGVSGAF